MRDQPPFETRRRGPRIRAGLGVLLRELAQRHDRQARAIRQGPQGSHERIFAIAGGLTPELREERTAADSGLTRRHRHLAEAVLDPLQQQRRKARLPAVATAQRLALRFERCLHRLEIEPVNRQQCREIRATILQQAEEEMRGRDLVMALLDADHHRRLERPDASAGERLDQVLRAAPQRVGISNRESRPKAT